MSLYNTLVKVGRKQARGKDGVTGKQRQREAAEEQGRKSRPTKKKLVQQIKQEDHSLSQTNKHHLESDLCRPAVIQGWREQTVATDTMSELTGCPVGDKASTPLS